uniref:receptor protein serine/threonine kinase n=1 Tax=Isodiametra pulchra TaxID=504439 RepID=A0A2P1DV98_ISOPU|nr:type II Bmp receptor [Isodiametra pulchra]
MKWIHHIACLLVYCASLSRAFICHVHLADESWSELKRLERNLSGGPRRPPIPRNAVECGSSPFGDKPCFTVFSATDFSNSSTFKIESAGCWSADNRLPSISDCSSPDCSSVNHNLVSAAAASALGFCCCTGHLCNRRVALITAQPPTEEEEDVSGHDKDEGKDFYMYLAVILISGAALSLLGLLFLILGLCQKQQQYPAKQLYRQTCSETVQTNLGQLDISPTKLLLNQTTTSDDISLVKLIGQGRYGTVWKGEFNGREVAVKLYKQEHKLYFDNEIEMFRTDLMKHEFIVPFFTGSSRVNKGSSAVEYLLVMAYLPAGSLMHFLKEHSFPFAQLVQLASSAAGALAFLHTELRRGEGASKPAVVHRDFNSRNILVKSDGTCAISDLGFAVKVRGARLFSGQSAELIPDVGTLRYMPPEVLEGSVDLNKCEAALKQVDVYALALVLWEIWSRCVDLCPSAVDPYRMPFEAELGTRPNFEDMRELVSARRHRPVIPPTLDESSRFSGAAETLRQTLEESWDQDSEARLTAANVHMRLKQLGERQAPRHFNLPPLDDTTRGGILPSNPHRTRYSVTGEEHSLSSRTASSPAPAPAVSHPNQYLLNPIAIEVPPRNESSQRLLDGQ